MSTATGTARLYVGTYAKYNNGSIEGKWLDLEDYPDPESFLEACKQLHKDESDPELMFQDFEGFPKGMYSESCNSDDLQKIYEWLELDEDERELLGVYRDNIDEDGTLEDAQDAYSGTIDTVDGWAEDYIESTGALESMPENLRYYFDYEKFARDAESGGTTFAHHNGQFWVFNNH